MWLLDTKANLWIVLWDITKFPSMIVYPLHSHQQCIRVPACPHLYKQCVFTFLNFCQSDMWEIVSLCWYNLHFSNSGWVWTVSHLYEGHFNINFHALSIHLIFPFIHRVFGILPIDFFLKILFFLFSPQSSPVHSCIFLVVGPSSCGMWDAASAWLDQWCHVHTQDQNWQNPGPPKQSMRT